MNLFLTWKFSEIVKNLEITKFNILTDKQIFDWFYEDWDNLESGTFMLLTNVCFEK